MYTKAFPCGRRREWASSFIKMSAAGSPTITISTNPLTSGIVEIYVWYVASSS